MEIILASTYGLCQGVKYALNIVDYALKQYPRQKIYLLNHLVHNDYICQNLERKGIIILDDSRSDEEKISSINDGIIIFSAHGHDSKLEDLAKSKNLTIIDSACPKVKLNNNLIRNSIKNKRTIIYIGINNHPETIASLSISKQIIFIDYKNPNYDVIQNVDNADVINQTTLAQEELKTIYEQLKKRISNLKIINGVCTSTSKRQNALLEYNNQDFILIIGDKYSSNSTRLFEIGKKLNHNCYQISSLDEVKSLPLNKYKKGFITAGASTPDEVINPIIDYLKSI